MSQVSNRQLVDEIRSGDRRGYAHLMEAYLKRLLYQCSAVFHLNPLDSEEIVDDVLVSVVQKISHFSFRKSDSDFHFWVMAIFRNKVKDFIRRRVLLFESHRGVECFSALSTQDTENFAFVEIAIRQYEQSVLESDGLARPHPVVVWIAELLDDMEPWERVLLRCRALEIPYRDIADYTGKTSSQLKVYHPRVKKKFLRLLGERHPELRDALPDDEKKKPAECKTDSTWVG